MLKTNTLLYHDQEASGICFKRNKEILTMRAENRKQIFNAKRILLTKTLNDHSKQTQEECNKAHYMRFVISPQFRREVVIFKKQKYKIEDFALLAKKLKSQEILQKIEGAIGMVKLYTQQDMLSAKYFEEKDLIKQLIKLARQSPEPQLQLEATSIIACISAESESKCAYLVKLNCIPAVMQIVRSQIIGLVEQGLWTMGNLSCEARYRDMFINQGAIPLIVKWLAKSNDPNFTAISAWALSNLIRGTPLPQYEQVAQGAAALCRILALGRITDDQTFIGCCWGISYHCDAQKNRQKHVMQTKLYIKIIDILDVQTEIRIVLPCIRILGNILIGNASIVQRILQYGFINVIQKHLYSQKKTVRRQACWTLSNIAASGLDQIQQIIRNSTLMDRLLEMLHFECQEDVRLEVVVIFCNMSRQQELNIDQFLINGQLVHIFLQLLSSDNNTIIIDTLKAIQNPLRASLKKKNRNDQISIFAKQMERRQISHKIQSFQYHENEEIYELSRTILESFFVLEDPLSETAKDTYNKLKGKKDDVLQVQSKKQAA